jgi:hypothetical protein
MVNHTPLPVAPKIAREWMAWARRTCSKCHHPMAMETEHGGGLVCDGAPNCAPTPALLTCTPPPLCTCTLSGTSSQGATCGLRMAPSVGAAHRAISTSARRAAQEGRQSAFPMLRWKRKTFQVRGAGSRYLCTRPNILLQSPPHRRPVTEPYYPRNATVRHRQLFRVRAYKISRCLAPDPHAPIRVLPILHAWGGAG